MFKVVLELIESIPEHGDLYGIVIVGECKSDPADVMYHQMRALVDKRGWQHLTIEPIDEITGQLLLGHYGPRLQEARWFPKGLDGFVEFDGGPFDYRYYALLGHLPT